jgi:tetratricopeptide (TPR) repeat protein
MQLDGDSLGYFIRLAQSEMFVDNFEKALEFVKKGYQINPKNIDILNSLGAINMFLGRYDDALKYYKEWYERLKTFGKLDIDEMHRIGYAYWINGYKEESDYYFNKQLEYCNRMIELGRLEATRYFAYYNLAGVYAFRGEKDKAYENLRIFNRKIGMPLWAVIIIKKDPLFNSIRNEPEFQQVVRDVEAKYQAEHERVRRWLEEQGMLWAHLL